MKCVRCGSEMKETDRCCLKCGAINYNNPQNENFAQKYASKSEMIKANPNLLNKKQNILKLVLVAVIIIVIIIIILKLMK